MLQLQLFAEPLRRSLNTLVNLLWLGALTLSRGLFATGPTTDDFGHGRRPVLGGDALGREVLRKAC